MGIQSVEANPRRPEGMEGGMEGAFVMRNNSSSLPNNHERTRNADNGSLEAAKAKGTQIGFNRRKTIS